MAARHLLDAKARSDGSVVFPDDAAGRSALENAFRACFERLLHEDVALLVEQASELPDGVDALRIVRPVFDEQAGVLQDWILDEWDARVVEPLGRRSAGSENESLGQSAKALLDGVVLAMESARMWVMKDLRSAVIAGMTQRAEQSAARASNIAAIRASSATDTMAKQAVLTTRWARVAGLAALAAVLVYIAQARFSYEQMVYARGELVLQKCSGSQTVKPDLVPDIDCASEAQAVSGVPHPLTAH